LKRGYAPAVEEEYKGWLVWGSSQQSADRWTEDQVSMLKKSWLIGLPVS